MLMETNFKVGDLVKLRGMNQEGTPIGIIGGTYPTRNPKYAIIKWTNTKIASQWALHRDLPLERLEKIE